MKALVAESRTWSMMRHSWRSGVPPGRAMLLVSTVHVVSPASATSTDMSLMMASVIKMRQPYCFVTACARIQKNLWNIKYAFKSWWRSALDSTYVDIFCTYVSNDAHMFHHLESGGHVDVGAQIWGVDLKLRADGPLEPPRVETGKSFGHADFNLVHTED